MDARPRLALMPLDVIHLILDRLDKMRDVNSLCIVLKICPGTVVQRRTSISVVSLLHAGAPLGVVREAIEQPRHRTQMSFDWILAGVRGRRVDVVDYVHRVMGISNVGDMSRYPTNGIDGMAPHTVWTRQIIDVLCKAIEANSSLVIEWLLRFYGSPAFGAPKAIMPRAVSNLCLWTLAKRFRHAPMVMRILHECLSNACVCSPYVLMEAISTDRPDVLECMSDIGCTARLDAARPADIDNALCYAAFAERTDAARWIIAAFPRRT